MKRHEDEHQSESRKLLSTIAKQVRTITEQGSTIAEQGSKIAELQAKLGSANRKLKKKEVDIMILTEKLEKSEGRTGSLSFDVPDDISHIPKSNSGGSSPSRAEELALDEFLDQKIDAVIKEAMTRFLPRNPKKWKQMNKNESGGLLGQEINPPPQVPPGL